MYQVDRKAAYATSGFELVDLMKKVFCLDARTLTYFLDYDLAVDSVT